MVLQMFEYDVSQTKLQIYVLNLIWAEDKADCPTVTLTSEFILANEFLFKRENPLLELVLSLEPFYK